MSLKKARFVKDCASYMQNCPAPARDVFTHASHLVSSLVVVPLLVDDRALGALYFTQDTLCDISNIQDALLVRAPAPPVAAGCLSSWHLPQPAPSPAAAAARGRRLRFSAPLYRSAPDALPRASAPCAQGFVHCVTLTLHNKLAGQMELLKGLVDQVGVVTAPRAARERS